MTYNDDSSCVRFLVAMTCIIAFALAIKLFVEKRKPIEVERVQVNKLLGAPR